MKKTMKKLSLDRVTVRTLNESLAQAAGGMPPRTVSDPPDCVSHAATCGRATVCQTKWWWC